MLALQTARKPRLDRATPKLGLALAALGALVALGFAQPARGAAPKLARITGEIERVTLADPGDVWSKATVVVAGQNVIVPRNLLVDLPANLLSMQQIFAAAPAGCLVHHESGLGKADTCNTSGMGAIATIEANRTAAGDVIAGDMFIAKGIEAINGTVTSIDYDQGSFRLNGTPGDPASGVMVRLNDPVTRHTRQQGAGCRAGSENCSPDPRFTEDADNYTQAFTSGYPLCLPSTVPHTFVDTLDLDGDGDRSETLTAQAAADGSGDLLCPDTNRTTGVAGDSRRLAPLVLGDNVTVQGNFETVGGVRFLSAWNTKVGTALSTANRPGQPDYMTINELFIDAPGFDRGRARSLFVGATTEPTSDVNLWSLHRDPTSVAHEFPLASVAGCDNADGAGTCTNVLGSNTWRIRHDVDLRGGRAAKLDPCAYLRADPRFGSRNICPANTVEERFAILSPIPREVQARTGRKIADLARGGGPVLQTVDVDGQDAPNGQYRFPMGMSLGGIEAPQFAEFDINAIGTPTIFAGLPWDLDRRLSPNGCDGACESTPQPLDPFPFSQRDPRTQPGANLPTGTYGDPNYTASQLGNARNRILSFVSATLGKFDGDNTLLAWPPVDPPAQGVGPVLPPPAPADITAPTVPATVGATASSTSQIDLSWAASTDAVGVTHYLVFRDGGPTAVAIVAAPATSFSDTGLAPGSTHTYAVQAVDAAGNTSGKSAPATATTRAPLATLSPTSLTFADQNTATTSSSQTITATNSGNAALSIATATITGADGVEFAKGADGCSAATLAPAASCTVKVTFAPATAGAKTATLRITDDAAGSPHTASLSGTATTPPAPAAPASAPASIQAPPTAPATSPPPAITPFSAPSGPLVPPFQAPNPPIQPTNVTAPTTVSAALTAPITVGATVPTGATVLQITVFSLTATTRTPARGRRLIATVYRNTPTARHYTFHLTEKTLRHPKPGRYLIEVRAGTTRTSLGPPTTRTITIERRR